MPDSALFLIRELLVGGNVFEAHEHARPLVTTARGGRDYAATMSDGHVSQAADRLVFARARRATAPRDFRSSGTASPVPKYISSGVWPRNAEWGSTWLCSCT